MTTESPSTWRVRRRSVTLRIALTLVSIVLIYQADRQFENYRNAVARTYSNGELWRWFIAAGMVLLAGAAVGFALRPHPVSRGFVPLRAVGMAVVPFFLAMSLPMFSWGWPGTPMGSWLWSVQMHFAGESLAVPMWLLVGLAIVAGFDEHDDTSSPPPAVDSRHSMP
ncbi:MAG: hypothetical protein GXP34_10965 [Actinobacteria bacterium]|nr:hypothetical protein [Actinomycetota bacterium]